MNGSQTPAKPHPWMGAASAAAAFLAVLLTAIYVAGSRLPPVHRQSVSGVVAATPDEVWDLLTDTASQANWRTGLHRTMLPDEPTSLVCWMEIPVFGSRLLCVEEEQPPIRRVLHVALAVPPFDGRWTFLLAPRAYGYTTVTIIEEDAIKSPVWRFVSRFLVRENPGQYLRDLQVEAVRRR